MVNAEETEELDNESFSLLEKPPTNGVISNKVDTNDEIQEDDEQRKNQKFSLTQKVALAMLATADFMSFCSMSIMAPFYPKAAASRGMSDAMSGFIFGYYALIMFLFSPVFGKILPKIGVKYMFISGLLLSGMCNVCFGALGSIQDYNLFTSLSFIIRGFEALGASAYSTASYVVVINTFPDNAGAVRGLLETFVGLGLSAGPGIGGILFAYYHGIPFSSKFGGFGVPFYTVGTIIVLLVPVNIICLPATKKCDIGSKTGSLMSLLKLPPVMMICMIMIVISMTWGFLDPTLEPHLRKFDLSPSNVGLIFLLISATYGVSCPIWGWLTDRILNYWWLMTTGLFFNAAVLMFLGPSPILYFITDSLWLNIFTLSTLGIFVGMALMPTYQYILDSALENGFGDNLGTHSLIAGLWSSIYSLGEVVGPTLGGTLVEYFGFPTAATTFAALNFILALCGFSYFYFRPRTNKDIPTDDVVSKKRELVKKDFTTVDVAELAVEKFLKNGVRIKNVKTK